MPKKKFKIQPEKIEANYISTPQTNDNNNSDGGSNFVSSPPENYDNAQSVYKPEDNATRRQIFAQNSAPTADYKEGDLWFDSDGDNTIYRASGDLLWVSVKDGSIAGKITSFRQSAIPTALAAGDLWTDTDDDLTYRATAAGDNEITAGEWELIASNGAIFGDNITGGGSGNTQVNNNGYATLFREDVFGDGSDGPTTYDGGGTSTLATDLYATDLTISNSTTLNPSGYRIFVSGTLTIVSGSLIARDGAVGGGGGNGTAGTDNPGGVNGTGGTAGTAGAALGNGSLMGALAGANGGAGGVGGRVIGGPDPTGGAGTAGSDAVKSLGVAGIAGVAGANGGNRGGSDSAGVGGAGGAAGDQTGTVFIKINNALAAINLFDYDPSGGGGTDYIAPITASASNGGSGGGGGGEEITDDYGGGGGGGGGASGSQGGIVVVCAKTVANAGIIKANGGNGGAGGDGGDGADTVGNGGGGGGGGAGGDGGQGGVLILVYQSYSGAGSKVANGGSGGGGGTGGDGGTGSVSGANGGNGNGGTTGTAGTLIEIES